MASGCCVPFGTEFQVLWSLFCLVINKRFYSSKKKKMLVRETSYHLIEVNVHSILKIAKYFTCYVGMIQKECFTNLIH